MLNRIIIPFIILTIAIFGTISCSHTGADYDGNQVEAANENMDDFTVLSSHEITVDYSRSTEDMLADNYHHFYMNADVPGLGGNTVAEVTVYLIEFRNYESITTSDILDRLSEKGYRSANTNELLFLDEKYPHLRQTHSMGAAHYTEGGIVITGVVSYNWHYCFIAIMSENYPGEWKTVPGYTTTVVAVKE
ncbi:MAG: hypothetical protein Q8O87_02195 [bacterium]|nr:hypothetical protein [bacterium]